MRKILILSMLSCLPITQLATLLGSIAQRSATNKPALCNPAPELPMHVFNYFLQ